MNHKIQLAYYALWIAHPVLQLAVAAVMFRRKLHRAFPVFFAYILCQVLIFATVFPIFLKGSYEHFFYVYWICTGLSLAIGFKVIHEIFLDVFRPYHTLQDLGSVLFKWSALVMLLVASIVAAASPANEQGALVQAILTVQRCVRVTQVGLILFLLVFSRYLGVSWRQHSFGIALGFGSFASAELVWVALRAVGYMSETAVSLANMACYNCAVLTWLGYALLKSRTRHVSAKLLMSERWNQSLGDLQHPVPSDSLIPLFESMVDRAFSRTNGDSVPEKSAVAQLSSPPAPPSRRSRLPLSLGRLASKT